MPLVGSSNLSNVPLEKDYERVLAKIQKAGQKASHLWSQAMGYVPDGNLEIFSSNMRHYGLMRNPDGKVRFCYHSMADGEKHPSIPIDMLSFSQTLYTYRRNGVGPAPEELLQSFEESLKSPLREYEKIEPAKASGLRRKLKFIESDADSFEELHGLLSG